MRWVMASLLLISPALRAQTDDRKPVFVAASIKLDPKAEGSDSEGGPGMLRAQMTLKHYIMYAYDVKPDQVTGGPNWTDAEHYAIVAKLENTGNSAPADATPRQRAEAERARLRSAMQDLLAERFQLKFHHETKVVPAYALTVAKGGFKPKEAVGATGHHLESRGVENGVKLTAEPSNMEQLAADLTRHLHVPVADMTHIRGLYNFTLEWTPDDLKNSASSNPLAGPSIFTALQEQLGLKLESQKATVDIIVVDSAQRPSEN